MCIKRKFDINKHWGKCCCYLEQYDNKNSVYWFDREKYSVIMDYDSLTSEKKEKIDTGCNGRYIRLPQYIGNMRYKELVKELNNAIVTKFFNESIDEDDACYRYRCFIDWNGLEQSEWYKTHLIVKEILIKWCDDNNIEYKYRVEKPPKNYIYNDTDLSKVCWIVDEI